jgi:hypothetical protein
VTTIYCRRVSHKCSCHFQNIFWCCATLIILLRFNNLIKFLPLKPSARKLLHKKFTFSNNHYVFGFIVEGISIDILWDNLQGLTNPILVVNILHICLAYQISRKDNYNLYGVISADYDGTLFSEKP